MKRKPIVAVAAVVLLAAGGSWAMKKGTVKFFNETKGFGFMVPVTTHFAEGTDLDLASADRAVKKGLNAVNVKRAIAGDQGEVDGLALYAIVYEPGVPGPDQPTELFTVRQEDFVDFVFEVSAAAAGSTAVYTVGRADTQEPIEIQFEWPEACLPAAGNLVVQLRLPVAAFADGAAVSTRGWDPTLLGAAFPEATLAFSGTGDHATFGDIVGLDAHAFQNWVEGTSFNKPELIDAISAEAKLTKADAGRIADALTSPGVTTSSDNPSGLGLFRMRSRPELAARDPLTGAPTTLRAKKVVKFKAGAELAKAK